MSHPRPGLLYFAMEDARCRCWRDARGVGFAERWDETQQSYLPISYALLMREGHVMSPDELAESLRRHPTHGEA